MNMITEKQAERAFRVLKEIDDNKKYLNVTPPSRFKDVMVTPARTVTRFDESGMMVTFGRVLCCRTMP